MNTATGKHLKKALSVWKKYASGPDESKEIAAFERAIQEADKTFAPLAAVNFAEQAEPATAMWERYDRENAARVNEQLEATR
jgi:hypothetical protein